MSSHPFNNIVLIGMPGAGKSTVGVLLAKELAMDFLDTDLEIQHREGRLLQEIVDTEGHLRLRDIESEVCISLNCSNSIIATGGSVVYCPEAMRHLASLGPVVWLDVSFAEIERRIHNFASRGIARRADQSLEDVFHERQELYQRYANVHIPCNHFSIDEVVQKVKAAVENSNPPEDVALGFSDDFMAIRDQPETQKREDF